MPEESETYELIEDHDEDHFTVEVQAFQNDFGKRIPAIECEIKAMFAILARDKEEFLTELDELLQEYRVDF